MRPAADAFYQSSLEPWSEWLVGTQGKAPDAGFDPLAYVIAPDLAASGVWTAIVIISVYWLGVMVSLRGGIGVIAKLASSGVLIGTLIPGALLVTLGIVYLAQGNPSAAPMDADHIFPAWAGIATVNARNAASNPAR
mgnify:CR=1 FL=1